MDEYISVSHKRCEQRFLELLDSDKSPKDAIQDEFDRYKVWATNTGAGHSGRDYEKSLDYRFRKASAYKDQILQILRRIEEILIRCRNANGVREIASQSNDPSSSVPDEAGTSDSEKEEEEDLTWSSSESEGPPRSLVRRAPDTSVSSKPPWAYRWRNVLHSNELEHDDEPFSFLDALGSLRLTITCLFRIPIRNAAPLSQQENMLAEPDPLIQAYRFFDKAYVQDLYPAASDWLLSRLANTLTRRRHGLRTRQIRNEKLKRERAGSTQTQIQAQSAQGTMAARNRPDAASFAAKQEYPSKSTEGMSTVKATTFQPARPPPDLKALRSDTPSEIGTVSSAAPTNLGHEKLILPPRPKTPQGDDIVNFECQFCCTAVHVRPTSQAWKKHILKDLEPYQCTHAGCETPDVTFVNRREWACHEDLHRSQYQCPFADQINFPSVLDFHDHLSNEHASETVGWSEKQLEIFRRPVARESIHVCPLCTEATTRITSHMSRHLERIAFFALPKLNQPEDDDTASFVSGKGSVIPVEGSKSSTTDSHRFNVPSIPSESDSSSLGTDRGESNVDQNDSQWDFVPKLDLGWSDSILDHIHEKQVSVGIATRGANLVIPYDTPGGVSTMPHTMLDINNQVTDIPVMGVDWYSQAPFIKELSSLLDDSSVQNVIFWSNINNSIVVKPSKELSKVLAQRFVNLDIASFVKQLNEYGFRKIGEVSKFQPAEDSGWEFRHESWQFKKGDTKVLDERVSPVPRLDSNETEYRELLRKCIGKIGKWFMELPVYRSWLLGETSLLHGFGIPSSGKTFIAARIVNELFNTFRHDDSIGIAYIFHNFGPDNNQSYLAIIRSLAKQLRPRGSDSTLSAGEFSETTKFGTQASIYDWLEELGKLMARFSRVFLVIDTIDKFSNSYPVFCDWLEHGMRAAATSTTETAPWRRAALSLLTMSRLNHSISGSSDRSTTEAMVTIRAPDEDISAFFDHINKQSAYQDLPDWFNTADAESKNQFLRSVASHADGMFMFAILCRDSLPLCKTRESFLQNLLQNFVNLPIPNHFCESELRRFKGVSEPQPNTSLVLLTWIIFAARPLTKSELQEAILIETLKDVDLTEVVRSRSKGTADISKDLEACNGLIVQDPDFFDTFHLAHSCIHDYFRHIWPERYPHGLIGLGMTCIEYLSMNTFEEGACEEYEQFSERMLANELYYYVSEYWAEHVRNTSLETDPLLLGFLANQNSINSAVQTMLTKGDRKKFDDVKHHRMTNLHLVAMCGLASTVAHLLNSSSSLARTAQSGMPGDDGRHGLDHNNGEEKAHKGEQEGDLAADDVFGIEAKDFDKGKVYESTSRASQKDQDTRGKTPLMYAAEEGHEEVVKVLLAHSTANINLVDEDRQTALSLAILGKHRPVVELLLAQDNIDVNIKNRHGQSPLTIAADRKRIKLAELLLSNKRITVSGKEQRQLHQVGLVWECCSCKYQNDMWIQRYGCFSCSEYRCRTCTISEKGPSTDAEPGEDEPDGGDGVDKEALDPTSISKQADVLPESAVIGE